MRGAAQNPLCNPGPGSCRSKCTNLARVQDAAAPCHVPAETAVCTYPTRCQDCRDLRRSPYASTISGLVGSILTVPPAARGVARCELGGGGREGESGTTAALRQCTRFASWFSSNFYVVPSLSCGIVMRWARDVIAPLLVASAPQDAVCFLGAHQSSVGARWHFRHLAGRMHAFDSSFSARWGLAERLHHDHKRSGVRLWSSVVLAMTEGSAQERDGAPTPTTPASTSTAATTRYTIDVDVHPDVASVAVKHALQLPRFLHHYPISSHTQAAYRHAVDFVLEFHGSKSPKEEEQQRSPLPVVLDSGCGTGRSSALLARAYPHLPVIGIDRSAVRLSKGGGDAGKGVEERNHQCDSSSTRQGAEQGSDNRVGSRRAHGRSGEKNHPPFQKQGNRGNRRREPLPENLLLLRADLVDLWILASRDNAWQIKEHYILYPNPYPKRSQLRSRWHGHSVFPVLLSLGGVITLRSNWKTYLDEVCRAVLAINGAAETTKGEGDGVADKGGVGDLESKRKGSGRIDGAGEVARTGVAVASATVSGLRPTTTLSANESDDNAETTGGDVSFGIGRSLIGDETRAEVPSTVAAAAASYAASARAGSLTFVPAVPAATNFEGKYVAVGETVYELRLEPQLS